MKQPQKKKLGATPGKLALVGVLAVVLVLVIVLQMPKRDEPASIPTAVAAQDKQTPARADDTKQPLLQWPTNDLTDALAHNPFALPDWVVQTQSTGGKNSVGLLADLQEQGASIVMFDSAGKSAIVGNKNVRVGDIVEGYRITDITTDGIVLDKLENRSSLPP